MEIKLNRDNMGQAHMDTSTHNQAQSLTPLIWKWRPTSWRENPEIALGGANTGHSNEHEEADPPKELH
jgi:hypothetical protein